MARIENIILHCSDSQFGCANDIRRWHVQRGWKDIGYHWVILNGRLNTAFYLPTLDGSIECGRRIDGDLFLYQSEIGAHALGYNSKSIGVCVIGTNTFTLSQMGSLLSLLKNLLTIYDLRPDCILGHYETESGRQQGKTCPNFDVSTIREELKAYFAGSKKEALL